MSQKKNTLIGGVAILSVAGILSKVIGMFYRIPLANLIGPGGMGIYSAVYNVYTVLAAISTAGIPVAISKLVSESLTVGRPREARATLRVALALLAAAGAILTLLLILFARPFSLLTGDAETASGYMAIAPSILLVSLMSAFRGYMQGRSSMHPTAISQLIEQLAKVALAYPLASVVMKSHGVVYAAAAALLGISIGEGIALLYMAVAYFRNRHGYIAEEARDDTPSSPPGVLARRITRIALPIVIGAVIVPLAGFIDAAMIRPRLQSVGFDMEAARSLYGLLTGYVVSLVNVPTALAMAVCVGLVPAISMARANRQVEQMHEAGRTGFRLASLIGMPSSVGMALLAQPIIRLIFSGLTPEETAIAGNILTLSAWTIVLFTHVQASTGILQGAGMQKVPMFSLLLGVLCKIVLNYTLIGVPSINIYGAPVASLVCYGVSMLVNILWIVRRLGIRFDWAGIVLRPGLASAGMGAAVFAATRVLDMGRRHNTLLAVAVGVLVYLVLIILTGALKRADMKQIPGGEKMERLLVGLRVWR